MRSIMIGLIGGLLALSAVAQTCTRMYWITSTPDQKYSSTAEVCMTQADRPYGIFFPENGAGIGNGTCRVAYSQAHYDGGNWVQRAVGADPPCPDICAAEAGKSINANFTVAWVKNPNAEPVDSVSNTVGDYLGPKLGSETCVNSCTRYIDALASGPQGYVSMVPGPNGLTRLSMDFVTIGQGKSCLPPPNDPSNPNTPSPPCPGTMGQVNGKPVCLPKAGPNSPPLPPPSNPASAPPAGAPVTPGNPAAGDQPKTGVGAGAGGTGRTPTVGDGGNAGGPSGAVGGGATGGSGTTGGGSNTPSPTPAGEPAKPRDPCGLPGTPACKMDEAGTGTGAGAFDGAKSAFDNAAATANAAITGAGTKTTSLGWTWGFTLPATVCTPFAWGKNAAYSVNPCTSPWILLFRQVMGYLFFGLAAMYIWRSTTAAPSGAK